MEACGGRSYKDWTWFSCQTGHSVAVVELVDLFFGMITLTLCGGWKEVERLDACGQAMESIQWAAVRGPARQGSGVD